MKNDDWEYVKVKGDKKIIMKKVGGKLKVIKIEKMTTPGDVKWFKK